MGRLEVISDLSSLSNFLSVIGIFLLIMAIAFYFKVDKKLGAKCMVLAFGLPSIGLSILALSNIDPWTREDLLKKTITGEVNEAGLSIFFIYIFALAAILLMGYEFLKYEGVIERSISSDVTSQRVEPEMNTNETIPTEIQPLVEPEPTQESRSSLSVKRKITLE